MSDTIAEAERARIQAISGCDAAKKLPKLADLLCVESDFSAPEAINLLNIAARELDGHVAAAKAKASLLPMPKPVRPGLGLGMPESTDKPSASAGWGKAVKHANKTAEQSLDAVGGEATLKGWAQAVHDANRRFA